MSASSVATEVLPSSFKGEGSSSSSIGAATLPKPPISGLIGILKPTGCTSMSLLEKLKPLLAQSKLFHIPADEQLRKNKYKSIRKRRRDADRFTEAGYMAPKIGQGGTLDPLADGVLVIGIGAGTKKLQQFLDCTKEYKTVGLLGTSTLSYDADEPILHRRPYSHINADTVEAILPGFSGKFKQLPPLYSAIRIDGKRLFDYAREGKDLPRPIEARDVEITHLQLVEWKQAGEHSYREPERECDKHERQVAVRARTLAGLEGEEVSAEESSLTAERTGGVEELDAESPPKDKGPPTFTLQMTVSSGTYVRSIVHDVGIRMKSAAHVVRLSRTRQGAWISPEYIFKEGEDKSQLRKAVDWDVLQRAIDDLANGDSNKSKKAKTEQGDSDKGGEEEAIGDDENKLKEWEKLLLEHMEVIAT